MQKNKDIKQISTSVGTYTPISDIKVFLDFGKITN